MTRAIAVANQKGGVGKTTTAINLSVYLALSGARVLLVDLDPQANATSGLGLEKPRGEAAYRALFEEPGPALREAIRPTRNEALHMLPTSSTLAEAEDVYRGAPDRNRRLARALGTVRSDYEFLVVDCPPSLGLFPLNALVACDTVLLPIQCEFFAMEGLTEILQTIRRVRQELNAALEIEGILLTMYQDELQLCREVTQELRGYFPDRVFQTVIPRDVALAESASHGLPILDYDGFSRGARGYIELAKEVLEHGGP